MVRTRLTRAATTLGLAGLLALALLGCGLVLGIEDKDARTTGAAGGGAAATGELCLDGVDDDGDGAIDCADDECADYRCAPPVPSDWLGPVTVARGPAASSCRDGETDVLFGGTGEPVVPPASCASCLCEGPPKPCSVTVDLFYGGFSCQGGAGIYTVGPFDGCVGGNYYAESGEVTAATPSGSCTPSGGAPLPPHDPVDLGEPVRLCQGPVGVGCEAGSVCLDYPEGSFLGLCIYRPGAWECPAGGYELGLLVREVATDDRSCTTCGCDGPSCDAGHVRLYGSTLDCSGQSLGTIPLDGTCSQLGTAVSVRSLAVSLDPLGACTPTGGEGTTNVTFAATTVCCLP